MMPPLQSRFGLPTSAGNRGSRGTERKGSSVVDTGRRGHVPGGSPPPKEVYRRPRQ